MGWKFSENFPSIGENIDEPVHETSQGRYSYEESEYKWYNHFEMAQQIISIEGGKADN